MLDYLKTIGRRFFRWGVGGAVAIVFYVIASLLGLPQWAVLVIAFIGAGIGAIPAMKLTERLFGEEPVPEPAPRGRGSGRRGASRRRS